MYRKQMARTKTSTPAPSTPTPAAAAAETKTKAPKTPKAKAAPAAEPAVASDAASTDGADASTLTTNFSSVVSKLQQFVSFGASLRAEVRNLERQVLKEIKAAQKVSAKKRRKAGNRAPSGFVKPTLISAELASFLGKAEGSEMARTEVTREINAYIRQHNLQDKENGRKINPDAKLKTLLKLKKGEELTYFNLQRYMSPHFAKAAEVAAQ